MNLRNHSKSLIYLCILGLFSKAIAMSGTNLGPWSQPAHTGVARKRATKLARQFDCYISNNWAKTIDCLRNVSAIRITSAFYDFFVKSIIANWNWCSFNHFFAYSGIWHRSHGSIHTSRWAGFTRCIYYKTSPWWANGILTKNTIYDRNHLRRRPIKIGWYSACFIKSFRIYSWKSNF